MQEAAEALEFERAARYRDRLSALAAIQGVQGINTQSVEEADVFALDEQAGQFCVEVFFFRNWQNWGNRAYFEGGQVDDAGRSARVVRRAVLRRQAGAAARAAFARDRGCRTDGCRPVDARRAPRRDPCSAAGRAAAARRVCPAERQEALGRRLADTASQQKLLVSLAQAFGLDKTPRRVEVYDNSHIMGASASAR